jgi:hypothetical protein
VEPARQLAWEYEVSESIMKDAIYGKRGYAAIPDPEKLKPEDKDPKFRAELKAMFTDYRSKQRREKRQSEKIMIELIKDGFVPQETPLHLKPSPVKHDWKAQEQAEKVAQNRHWKGWD